MRKRREEICMHGSTGVDVHVDSDEKDGDKGEEEEGVNKYRDAAGLKSTKLHHPPLPRNLTKQPRSQQHEQRHRDHHRCPIRHRGSLSLLSTYRCLGKELIVIT